MHPRETTLQALRQFRGDDAARARAAFRQYTPEEMEQDHGQSCRTRAEILADYERREREVDEAIQWVHSLA